MKSLKSILDHPSISMSYFFPSGRFVSEPFVVESGDVKLACLFYKRDVPLCIIHFHGNGEEVVDYMDSPLLELDASILFAEYRGFGMSGGVPQLVAMMDDVEAFVQASGYSPQNIVFMGRSVGSIYAIEAAARYPECAGLVIESGIADVAQRLLMRIDPAQIGTSAETIVQECRKYFDHEKKLRSCKGRSLVLHARHDTLVDHTHAYSLHRWSGGDSRLVIFEKGDHNSVLRCNRQRYLDEVDRFLGSIV